MGVVTPAIRVRTFGRVALLLLGVGALLLTLIASLALGARDIDPAVVIGALTGTGEGQGTTIIREIRLPRALLGMAVGVGLGMAGLLMQRITRNPIADPGILGVSSGASLAVVLGIAWFGVTDPGGQLWFALAGAAFAAVVVYWLGAAAGGGLSPIRLTLAGAIMTAFLGAITSAILVRDSATLAAFRFWDVGSLAGRDPSVLAAVLPALIIGTVLALGLSRALDALALGDDVAVALGQRVFRVRLFAAVAIVLLAGAAVAAAGPIVFVGLVVPHVAQAIAGTSTPWVALWCLIIGPILLLLADTIGRVVLRPSEMQVGIVTALIGVPVLIALVRRRRLGAA